MPSKPQHVCSHPGCQMLTDKTYCDEHQRLHRREDDKRRGSARNRGYSSRWDRYSKWYLRQPEHVLCRLRLDGCTGLAECVDHIDPPNGPDDPRFWDAANHQPACIHCNSAKGRKKIIGKMQSLGGRGA